MDEAFQTTVPDLALLVEGLGSAEFLHFGGEAEDAEEPAAECDGVAGAARVVEALAGFLFEDAGAGLEPVLEGVGAHVGT